MGFVFAVLTLTSPADANTDVKRYQLLRMGKRLPSEESGAGELNERENADASSSQQSIDSTDGTSLNSRYRVFSTAQLNRNTLNAPTLSSNELQESFDENTDSETEFENYASQRGKRVQLMRMGKRFFDGKLQRVQQLAADVRKRLALMRMG